MKSHLPKLRLDVARPYFWCCSVLQQVIQFAIVVLVYTIRQFTSEILLAFGELEENCIIQLFLGEATGL